MSVAFDESLNKVSQKTQMDVCVRFGPDGEKQLSTRYYNSAFLGSAKATDLLENLKVAAQPIDFNKIIHLSMDGPNVNLKMKQDLIDEKAVLNEGKGPKMLETGTCSLHVVSNAFKVSVKELKWGTQKFLISSFYFFHNFPSRKALFIFYTKTDKFPLKFRLTRWLENIVVIERMLEIIPSLKKFIECTEKDKKFSHSENFTVIKKHLEDPLLPVKLTFVVCLANEVEPFLRQFQTEDPLVPFSYTALKKMLLNDMKQFVTEEALSDLYDLTEIDLNEDKKIPTKNIDLSFRVKAAFRKVDKSKYKDIDILSFKKDACQCFKRFCLKLLDKCPLKYPIIRALSSLDPLIACKKTLGAKRFEKLLNILNTNNWIGDIKGENALNQFKKIQDTEHLLSRLQGFSLKDCRVDVFWTEICSKAKFHVNDFPSVMQMCLILFNGNASVERSFSINNETLVPNLVNESLIARRIVHDEIISAGGVINVRISKPLITHFRLAYSKFTAANKLKADELKKATEKYLKRKNALAQIEILKKKKRDADDASHREKERLDEEIASLRKML